MWRYRPLTWEDPLSSDDTAINDVKMNGAASLESAMAVGPNYGDFAFELDTVG
jgi:hypothetical protein